MTTKLTTTYARRTFYVDAVQVTKENMAEVAEWCGGEIRTNKNNTKYIFVRVIRPIKETQCMAFVDDWVLGAGTSYKVYKDRVFRETFELSSGKKELLEGPHSRACGIGNHSHGKECHSNCPTCGSDSNPIMDGGPCGKTNNTVDHAPCILNKGHENGPNPMGCRSKMNKAA